MGIDICYNAKLTIGVGRTLQARYKQFYALTSSPVPTYTDPDAYSAESGASTHEHEEQNPISNELEDHQVHSHITKRFARNNISTMQSFNSSRPETA